MRYKLYAHQRDIINKVRRLLKGDSPGIKPTILTILEERFRKASFNLEQVNTDALIDGTYIQEKFNFFGNSLNCEKWDYFCRVLPNLLLAFGLLGTFIGITINLQDLSQTINQAQFSDINQLIEQIQQPLQGMGIAFFTSLIGILCSSILTVVNIRWNTNLSKNLLISSLADYLDNVFQDNLNENGTRLDKAVNKMVAQQNEFLLRFHQKVGDVLETTIGRETRKMTDANAQAQQLVIMICNRLMEVSGTLSNGANVFRESLGLINQEVVALTEVLPKVREYAQVIGQSAIVFQGASQKIEQSKFSENLEQTVTELVNTHQNLTYLIMLLKDNVEKLIGENLESNQIAKKVYTQLESCSSQLKESSTELVKVSQTFKESEFATQLTQATQKLEGIEGLFEISVLQLNQGIKPLENLITSLQKSIDQLSLNEQKILQNEKQNLNNNLQKNQLNTDLTIEQKLKHLKKDLGIID
ncbi:hypothetical protein C7H19_00905 [Aphanothece hegewaldii CCALA 016]|uniref:Uncharacterized protein n=2 Tax=Aphanothece TaxID=1121 RepID=A0A2T1M3G4_9CHRO|nr:hypothetical protein C7H19_00905 [Aphanothece hegewaldii CCALA 016]